MQDLTALLLPIFYLANFLCVFGILFLERKNPTVTISWLLVLTYLPFVGLFLYVFFGRGFHFNAKKRIEFKIALEKRFNELSETERLHLACTKTIENKYADLVKFHLNMSNSFYTDDNSITIFTDARDKYNNLLKDILNAKHSINLLYFIIKNDNIGKKIVSALTLKAKEGVKVKIIYDAVGSFGTSIRLFSKLRRAGGEVHKFSPLISSFLQSNYRNHRKIAVIDGEVGYIGGMNIGDEYMGLNKKISPWRDTHLRITGSAVLTLQFRFFLDWAYVVNSYDVFYSKDIMQYFPEKKCEEDNVGVQIVSSGPDVPGEEIKRGIIKMIYRAKKYVYIQTPYLVPDNQTIEALQTAAASGVDVCLMIPKIADHWPVYKVTIASLEQLMNYGVKIYIYDGFVHAKMVVVDGEVATIGTTNFDIRSFVLHFEVNAFIYNDNIATQCEQIFRNDMENSTLLTMEEYKSRGLISRFFESIFRLFAPLM